MKKIHISYGNNNYNKSLDLLEKTSLEIGGIETFIRYTEDWLKTTEFYKKNVFILSKPRGNGYFIWKPFIILESFKTLEEGDVVLYTDAGLNVIQNLSPLFEIIENNKDSIIIFKLPAVGVSHHKNKAWTKRDAFILTNCDSEKYWNADMGNGAVSLWKKTEKNIQLLNEWLKYLRDPRISSDDINMCGPNFLEFKDHRHDQSVLSILSVKYNLELFRDPTQYGNSEIDLFSNSPYQQLFYHHRNFKH